MPTRQDTHNIEKTHIDENLLLCFKVPRDQKADHLESCTSHSLDSFSNTLLLPQVLQEEPHTLNPTFSLRRHGGIAVSKKEEGQRVPWAPFNDDWLFLRELAVAVTGGCGRGPDSCWPLGQHRRCGGCHLLFPPSRQGAFHPSKDIRHWIKPCLPGPTHIFALTRSE